MGQSYWACNFSKLRLCSKVWVVQQLLYRQLGDESRCIELWGASVMRAPPCILNFDSQSMMYAKRKANSPCESSKQKILNQTEEDSSDSFESLDQSMEMMMTDVAVVRILTKNGENFVGALDRPQAFMGWTQGVNAPSGIKVVGIALNQQPDRPFMIDYHLNKEMDMELLNKKYEFMIDDNKFTAEIVVPKPPPPKLGEEVDVTFKKTRFKIKPEHVNAWVLRFGALVKPANYVDAGDLKGVHTDDIVCTAKLRKHIPSILPAYGRKVNVRYPGQPLQCNKCYQYNHLRARCENPTIEWVSYVRVFITEEVATSAMIGEWATLLK